MTEKQSLQEKIDKMKRGLQSSAIHGAARMGLETALANAQKQLAEMDQLMKTDEFLPEQMNPFGPQVIHSSQLAEPTLIISPRKKVFTWGDYPLCRKFMPQHQQKVVQAAGEEREAIATQVEKMLAQIPGAYGQDEVPNPIVYAHYFYGQSDWFITEFHPEPEDPQYSRFFGFTILNGDSQMAESGYISLSEFKNSNKVELDFHWRPVTLREAKFDADPAFFPDPNMEETPEDSFLDDETPDLKQEQAAGILLALKNIAPIPVYLNADRRRLYEENENRNDHFENLRDLTTWTKEMPRPVLDAITWLDTQMERDNGITGPSIPVSDRLTAILRPVDEPIEQPAVVPVKVGGNKSDCAVNRNLKKNGIEIQFPQNPSDAITQRLKANGFRWSRFQKLWYVVYSEARHQFALDLCRESKGSDNPASMPDKTSAPLRLITKDSLTKNGKVAKNLLIREIEAGKMEAAAYKRFDGMSDSTEYLDKGNLDWVPATMDLEYFDIRELANGSVNNHWSNSIRFVDNNGHVQLGSLEFRYKGDAAEQVMAPIMPENDPVEPQRLLGRTIKIILPTGEEHDGQFAIMELDQVTASHNERTFASSPGYPTNHQGRNANDRNYAGDKQAQALVQEYARNLKPELLITTSKTAEGTPIITESGLAVSGNNRTMSLKLAATDYPGNYVRYVTVLREELTAFGFSEHMDLTVFQHPVLVRIDYQIPAVTTDELAKYNAATTKGSRPIDASIALSSRLTDNPLCSTNIPKLVGAFDTMSDFYADRNAQKHVKDQLIGCNLLTQQQIPQYYDPETGMFNEEGKTFLERTLAAAILSPDALQAAETDGVKGLRKSVVNALPALLENKGLEDDASLIEPLDAAIIFQQKMAAAKLSFADLLAQKSIFEAETTYDRRAVVLNRLLNVGQRAFKFGIVRYNETVKANAGDSLFGSGEKVSPEEAFEKLIFAATADSDQRVITRAFGQAETVLLPVPGPDATHADPVESKARMLRKFSEAGQVKGNAAVELVKKVEVANTTLQLLKKALPRLEAARHATAVTEIELLQKFLKRQSK